MARTSRSKPLVWLILGALAGLLAAILTTTGCEGRRSPPKEDAAPVAKAVEPPAADKPAPPPRPEPAAEPPPAAIEPPPALSEEAQLADDAAASGMTSQPPAP